MVYTDIYGIIYVIRKNEMKKINFEYYHKQTYKCYRVIYYFIEITLIIQNKTAASQFKFKY